jgi:hypothetical protein
VIDPRERLGGPQQPGRLLFDLDTDPAETTDLSGARPDLMAELAEAAAAWSDDLDRWRSAAVPTG